VRQSRGDSSRIQNGVLITRDGAQHTTLVGTGTTPFQRKLFHGPHLHGSFHQHHIHHASRGVFITIGGKVREVYVPSAGVVVLTD
jgi:hypothetical protein